MAIHPIDLSTVYTQMDKVAKYSASQNQNAELAGMVNLNKSVQEDMQKAQSVQQTGKDQETDSSKIKDEKKSGENGKQFSGKNKNENEEDDVPKKIEIQDSNLGNSFDITL